MLSSLDLELRSGETVGCVGPSGAGKSTVASVLLLGLVQPDVGTVRVGYSDLGACDLNVPGGPRWGCRSGRRFRGTVADNIRLGVPHATDGEVRVAAEVRGADAFVEALPRRHRTRRRSVTVGTRAVSAGRARASRSRVRSSAKPDLLILDQPTAIFDPGRAWRSRGPPRSRGSAR